jgi:hypothetical protein
VRAKTFYLPTGPAARAIAIAVVSADATAIAWLEEFLAPPFAIDSRRAPDVVLRLEVDAERHTALTRERDAQVAYGDEPFFRLDQGVVVMPTFRVAGATFAYDAKYECFYALDATTVEVVGHPRSPVYRAGVMRVVREIASVVALRGGAHLLHAGGIARDGEGILIAGRKEAGKSTLLCYLAPAAGAQLLANDRMLVWRDDGGLEVCGIPTVVGFRPQTLALFPELVRDLPAVPRPSALTVAELRAAAAEYPAIDARARIRLSPSQLESRLGVARAARVPLRAMLFPQRGDAAAAVTIARLPADVARACLEDARFGAHSSPQTTVFERVWGTAPADALGAASAAGAEGRHALYEAIASSVPCYRVGMTLDAYRTGAARARVLAVLDVERARVEGGVQRTSASPGEGGAATDATLRSPAVVAILARFGSPVVAAERITSLVLRHSPRSAYRVTFADGRRVKLRRLRRPERAERACRLLAALDDARFAAVLLRHDDVVVEEWVEGTPLAARPPRREHVEVAAGILATVHRVAIDTTTAAETPASMLETALARVALLANRGHLTRATATRLASVARRVVPVAAPVGITHNDLCGENLVLDTAGRVHVVDNEALDIGFLEYDLARTWYRWDLDATSWRTFLASYIAAGAARPDERASVFWRIAAVTKSAAARLDGTPAALEVALAKLRAIAAGA